MDIRKIDIEKTNGHAVITLNNPPMNVVSAPQFSPIAGRWLTSIAGAVYVSRPTPLRGKGIPFSGGGDH